MQHTLYSVHPCNKHISHMNIKCTQKFNLAKLSGHNIIQYQQHWCHIYRTITVHTVAPEYVVLEGRLYQLADD